jgi:hypothetical protein
LLWFNSLDSSQNGQNGLIHNWCIGGWRVTAALYGGKQSGILGQGRSWVCSKVYTKSTLVRTKNEAVLQMRSSVRWESSTRPKFPERSCSRSLVKF